MPPHVVRRAVLRRLSQKQKHSYYFSCIIARPIHNFTHYLHRYTVIWSFNENRFFLLIIYRLLTLTFSDFVDLTLAYWRLSAIFASIRFQSLSFLLDVDLVDGVPCNPTSSDSETWFPISPAFFYPFPAFSWPARLYQPMSLYYFILLVIFPFLVIEFNLST